MSQPVVSVLIVSWNSAANLSRWLDALSVQLFKDFELIIVANGSTDNSIDSIQQLGLPIRIQQLQKNDDSTTATNIGARLSRGRWLVLLNPDAFPAPDWLGHP